MKIVEGIYYSKDHEWIKVDGDEVCIGITDYAQHALGEVVYVEMPEIDDELDAGDAFGVIESVKAASDSYMPVSGSIVEVNEELETTPQLLNSSPYDSWILKVKISDSSELDSLMSHEDYKVFCERESN